MRPQLCCLSRSVLLHLAPQIRSRRAELRVLDDAGVHVHQVQRAIGRVDDADRTEEGIGGADELGLGVGVSKLREAVSRDDFRAADDPRDGLVEEQIADEIPGKSIAAIDLDTGCGREVIERAVRQPDAVHAALHVRDSPRGRIWNLEVGLEVVPHVECAIGDGRLKIDRTDLAAAVHPPHLSVVVLRGPPLTAIRFRLFTNHFPAGSYSEPVWVVGHVQPVVERPREPSRLPFHVRHTARACVEELFLVRDAVTVRVGVAVHVAAVRLQHEEHAILKRVRHARQHEVVDEHRVLVVQAVTVCIFVAGDAADRLARCRALRVLHVGPHLEDVHPPVSVERHADGILDQRVGEHWLDLEAGRQQEILELPLRRLAQHRRTLQEVSALRDLRFDAAAAARRCCGWRGLPLARRLRHGRLAVQDDGSSAAGDDECGKTGRGHVFLALWLSAASSQPSADRELTSEG